MKKGKKSNLSTATKKSYHGIVLREIEISNKSSISLVRIKQQSHIPTPLFSITKSIGTS